MLTLKEQLIQELRHTPMDKIMVSVEVLDTGERNEMEFRCMQDDLVLIIHNGFDDNLHGCVPNGQMTTIKGWYFKE